MLRTYCNAVADGDSDLLAIAAGPFCDVVVKVSEDFVEVLDCHVPDDSSLTARRELKSEKVHNSEPVRLSVSGGYALVAARGFPQKLPKNLSAYREGGQIQNSPVPDVHPNTTRYHGR
jgi:hypothetical protein